MKRLLLLEDGSVFEGEAFGADVETSGEIVFSTGMTGYQESITDQSYNGQIITFTYPLIGNYGINRDDYESIRPTCKGVVVYEWAEYPSNWRQQMTLDEFLKLKGIPGISGIDTRALTKIIRKHGTMKACLINEGNSIHEALENLQESVLLNNQIEQVSTKLSNLYTAQENVQAMVNVQSGNISNYQKNLLDSATNFQNIFPALVNQSSSSITANESLKKSLEASDNMFNDLVTTQTNTGKDLSSLIEQRHQDSISYEAFSTSLLEMNNELLEKQLSDIITQAQKDQETLSSQLNSIMGDDNNHNHKENSSAYLNVARQKIQELSEALKSQDNIAKDQSEQLDKIVREGLASYFAKNNKDNITLLELLKSHSTNEKTLKDFKAKVADFTNSLISSIPSLNLSELHLTQEEEKAIQFTSSDSEIIKKVSNERTLYLNTNLLNRLFEARKNRDEAKIKLIN